MLNYQVANEDGSIYEADTDPLTPDETLHESTLSLSQNSDLTEDDDVNMPVER